MHTKLAQILSEQDDIPLIILNQLIAVVGFKLDEEPTFITHKVIVRIRVQDHGAGLTSFYITLLAHYIIIGKAWMKQDGVIVDVLNKELIFQDGYCSHEGTPYTKPLKKGESPEPSEKKPVHAQPLI